MVKEIEGLTQFATYTNKGLTATILHTKSFDSLPDQTKKQFEPELIKTATLGFQRSYTNKFASDVSKHIRDGDLLIVIVDDFAEGFAVRKKVTPTTNLCSGVCLAGAVKTNHAPSGVIQHITKQFIERSNPKFIGTRTQNDEVVKTMIGLCPIDLAPIYRPGNTTDLEIAKRMGLIPNNKKFNLDQMIIEKCYGEPMIAGPIRNRVNNPQVLTATNPLNYNKGDALVLIGRRR